MHSYLRAIGFSRIKTVSQGNLLIGEIVNHYDHKNVFEDGEGRYIGEYYRSFGEGAGLCVVGEYNEKSAFCAEYLFPYVKGQRASCREEIIFEKHAAWDSFTGACDDLRLGTTLIFYLQNMGEYCMHARHLDPYRPRTVELSALALSGTILLPSNRETEKTPALTKERRNLLRAAREGDEEAMESLTMEDMDMYSMLMERVAREDLLTIVDSYFMPDGSECERYSVLGTILGHSSFKNALTGEKVVRLELECNDVRFDVCLNEADLLGEPAVGRRFKGNIWMQGYVHFD